MKTQNEESDRISVAERETLRRLADRKQRIGEQPRQQRVMNAWRGMNDLRPVRPMVWIDEIPWPEFEAADPGALRPVCRDPVLRQVEQNLRRELYQWDHFPCDMVVEPVVYVPIVGSPTSSYADYGIREKTRSSSHTEDVVFLPVLQNIEDADRIRMPEVVYDRVGTDRRLERVTSALDGVIPVRRRGLVHQWHAPWDQIIRWYGIEPLYVDLVENPERVHRVISNFCRALSDVLDRQTALGMLDVGNGNWRVGSGGMGCASALPERVDGRAVTPADQWGCSNAQIFSEVSPEMHEEFSLTYERPLLARFGLVYYGCCEPLHRKIHLLRTLPNLRKISVSPKADLPCLAGAVGREYVLSVKADPALLAWEVFDEGAVRAEWATILQTTRDQAVEIILKDLTTVRGDPRRLGQWAALARAATGGE
jgi:hypothetical protein